MYFKAQLKRIFGTESAVGTVGDISTEITVSNHKKTEQKKDKASGILSLSISDIQRGGRLPLELYI